MATARLVGVLSDDGLADQSVLRRGTRRRRPNLFAATSVTVGVAAAALAAAASVRCSSASLEFGSAAAFLGACRHDMQPEHSGRRISSHSKRSRRRSPLSLQALRQLKDSVPGKMMQQEDIAYEGLDDLDLEEEDLLDDLLEEAEEIEYDTKPGDGVKRLEALWDDYSKNDEEPDLEDDVFKELCAAVRKDVPRCPSASTVAWMAHTLEEMGLEDDETFEVIEEVLVERAEELGVEDTLNAVVSYGNLYWVGPDKDHRLLNVLSAATRRQLNDFTLLEVAKLANALMRMGATDDTKHAGLFFEMNKRVYLPSAEKYIRDAANRDSSVYQESEEVKGLLDDFAKKGLSGGRHQIGPAVRKAIGYGVKQLDQLAEEEEMRREGEPGLNEVMEDMMLIKDQEAVTGNGAEDVAMENDKRNTAPR